jgi:tryptophanyl-tRNA synthetase
VARVLSGIQPTGGVHLGNYAGAISRWAAEQRSEHFFCIVDLHALTGGPDPHTLRDQTHDMAAWLLAAGLDPEICTLFVQSHVGAHTELSWVLECVATYGELSRMTQFKEKAGGQESVPAGLFTYPVLQAADILAYHADEVPVGADQRQHIELTRTIAERFNARYGEVLTPPEATFPPAGARVMDLQHPEAKMSKTAASAAGTIMLGDDEETTRTKIMRAVTDSGSEIRRAEDKPGVTNLIELMSVATAAEPGGVEASMAGKGYGELKREVAEAVNAYLRPVRDRHAELRAEPAATDKALRAGAEKARQVAEVTLATVHEHAGLLPRSSG